MGAFTRIFTAFVNLMVRRSDDKTTKGLMRWWADDLGTWERCLSRMSGVFSVGPPGTIQATKYKGNEVGNATLDRTGTVALVTVTTTIARHFIYLVG